MHPELQALREGLNTALDGAAPAELAVRPIEGKWSALEVLEHLTLTYTGTTKGLERCLASGSPSAGKARFPDRVRQWVVTGFRFIPGGREAPAVSRPKGSLTAENAVEKLTTALQQMDETLCE